MIKKVCKIKYDLFSVATFSKVDFIENSTALDLIKALKSSGIFIPDGNDDIDKLNNLLVKPDLYKMLSNLPLSPIATKLSKNVAKLDMGDLMILNRELLDTAFPQEAPKKLSLHRLTGSLKALCRLFTLVGGRILIYTLNLELKKDIRSAMEAIIAIEDFERNRKLYVNRKNKKGKNKHRVFPTNHIGTLNSLLEKIPINLGVTFHVKDFLSNQEPSKKSYVQMPTSTLKKIDKLGGAKYLHDLRFRLVDQESSFHTDEHIRNVLTYGLFYYADQLMRKKFPRPKKCVACPNWFLAKRKSHGYCSKKCKDYNFGQSDSGKESRRLASQKFREKTKKVSRSGSRSLNVS